MTPTDASSAGDASLFVGLRVAGLRTLVEATARSGTGALSLIRRQYEASWVGFEAATEFLEKLGFLRLDAGAVRADASLVQMPDFGSALLNALAKADCAHREEVRGFLSHFRRGQEGLEYTPIEPERSSHSHVRNFLMDLGAITAVVSGVRYRVTGGYEHALYRLMRPASATGSGALGRRIGEKAALGMKVELAVLQAEVAKVGETERDRVVHTSQFDAEAGYDIQSVSSSSSVIQPTRPVYIEVKAVSPLDFGFFWSRNERAAASWLGADYCLVLVPVMPFGEVDLRNARVVWNPVVEVDRRNGWSLETEVWHCSTDKLGASPEGYAI